MNIKGEEMLDEKKEHPFSCFLKISRGMNYFSR